MKFGVLIQDVKDLADGLQNITESIFAASHQGGMLRLCIQQIKNSDTLDIISRACEVDYPDISEAVTVKRDVMKVEMLQHDDIQDGVDKTKDAADDSSLRMVPKAFKKNPPMATM
ncbi:hypothetical protein EJ04DRAFT_511118 [Polyplosphaeria fusca]|uniref:Uncharacterized protein n=1 Tax=Polyplosphaeria fusca TaxID=682080 RepID=A0A9P4R447_9PLEO|nr:hypothetical protein EJ04DRAFT_511118 [Polyplosphaeria fusca]